MQNASTKTIADKLASKTASTVKSPRTFEERQASLKKARPSKVVTLTAKKKGHKLTFHIWAQGDGKADHTQQQEHSYSGALVTGFLFAQEVWGKKGKVIIIDATEDDRWPRVFERKLSDTTID